MHPRARSSPFRALPGHFVMGAALGVLLALSVICAAVPPIAQMISNEAAPRLTMTIFVGAFAAMFAVGATLTGWIFIAMEER